MDGNIWLAFGLTAIAGLSTGIGSIIAFWAKDKNTNFLSASLGFSAGVMIYVSFVELFPTAKDSLIIEFGHKLGVTVTTFSFFGGVLLIALIDKLIPEANNPHEIHHVKTPKKNSLDHDKLMRTGLFTALAITIHNFPEGLATFVSALYNPSLAIPIVVAIALHNIPEGIAVSVPIYYATGNKKKAFLISFASGLSEPIGAILGYLLLMRFMNEAMYGIIFAGVAGIMVFISIDELLPAAHEYGKHHLAVYGLIAGMLIMALSLLLLM